MKLIANIFGALARRASFKNVSGPSAPTLLSEVHGLAVTCEVKEGVLLTCTPPDDTTPHPASESRYYEISVQSNGQNPEYPKDEKAGIARFTVGLQPDATGFLGNIGYIPANARFTGFRVAEEFDDGNHTMGRRMPPHHAVMICADYKAANGETLSMAMGSGHIRLSELNLPAWKMAASSPIFYI